jgi:hypothetical protein
LLPSGGSAQQTKPPNREQIGIDAITPNPLTHGPTVIRYVLPTAGAYNVQIFSIDGALVASLVEEDSPSGGVRTVMWDGRARDGSPVANGLYFCRLSIGKLVRSKSILVMR